MVLDGAAATRHARRRMRALLAVSRGRDRRAVAGPRRPRRGVVGRRDGRRSRDRAELRRRRQRRGRRVCGRRSSRSASRTRRCRCRRSTASRSSHGSCRSWSSASSPTASTPTATPGAGLRGELNFASNRRAVNLRTGFYYAAARRSSSATRTTLPRSSSWASGCPTAPTAAGLAGRAGVLVRPRADGAPRDRELDALVTFYVSFR